MRSTLEWVLVVFSVVAILLAVTAFWARDLVFHGDSFQEAIGESVRPEPVRRAIATRAVDAMLGDADAPVARDLLVATLTGLLGSETLGETFDATARLAWRVLVEREPAAVTLDLTTARDYARALVAEPFPEVTARIDLTPTPFVITLVEQDELPSLAPYRAPAARLAWILLAAGLAGGIASILVSRPRGRAAGRLAAMLLGGSAALLAGLVLLRVTLPPSMPTAHAGVVVARTLHVLTANLATALGILTAVGLVSTLLTAAWHRGRAA